MEKENSTDTTKTFFINTPIHIAAELFVFAILTAFFTIKIRGLQNEINEIKKQLVEIDTATNYKKIIGNQVALKTFTENHIIKLYEEIQELKNLQNNNNTIPLKPEINKPPTESPVASLFKNLTQNAFTIAIAEEEKKPEKATIEIEEIVMNEEELDNELQEEYKAMKLQEEINPEEIETEKKSVRKNTKSSRKRNTST